MRKLAVMFLGIIMVISLAGCGGGGGGNDDPGAMDAAVLSTRYNETTAVSDAADKASGYLNSAMGTTSASRTFESQIIKAEGAEEGVTVSTWSATHNADGWYTASAKQGESSGTAKMRYLAATATTELIVSLEGDFTSPEGDVIHMSGTISTSISKGSNGLWNGYIDKKENVAGTEFSHKNEFKNVDAANGCGEYIDWVGEEQDSNFTITMEGTKIYVTGFGHDATGTKKDLPKVEVTP